MRTNKGLCYWTAAKKKVLVERYLDGSFTPEHIWELYHITTPELEEWVRLFTQGGPGALRTTHLQKYRRKQT